ncbi:hypothetical protein DY000_02059296 [Brassica cretica]|uniref:Uncharacterized protein n=1 Tax=Brassica cretica TaxID=69181 RepID=A0ABQ7B2D7_BRACR|nr:hypothetical protein DY000_02059296 [Brassica cretica]
MMVLHRSCEGALFLGGQKRPMLWQTHSRGDIQTNAWLGAAGHALRTEWTVFKIRKALPKSVFN